MNKRTKKPNNPMKSRHDFTKGKRSAHAARYQSGHEVHIERADGSVTIQHFGLEDGAVVLEPDVRAVFKDSDAVNLPLRCLIPLVRPNKSKIAG